MQVLDQRDLQRFEIVERPHHDRHVVQLRLLRRPPASFAGDDLVAVGIAGSGYHFYYWRNILVENRVSAIQDLMMHHPRVWLLYTFKPDMYQRRPKLMKFALDNFVEQQVFPGMVVDGDIHVSLFSRPSVTVN